MLKIHTVRVFDASSERRDAEHLYDHMREVISLLTNEWNVEVVALTSDASGESRKARKMLSAAYPHIIAPDCYAHQVSMDEFSLIMRLKAFR